MKTNRKKESATPKIDTKELIECVRKLRASGAPYGVITRTLGFIRKANGGKKVGSLTALTDALLGIDSEAIDPLQIKMEDDGVVLSSEILGLIGAKAGHKIKVQTKGSKLFLQMVGDETAESDTEQES